MVEASALQFVDLRSIQLLSYADDLTNCIYYFIA